jgi:hypothetical protein
VARHVASGGGDHKKMNDELEPWGRVERAVPGASFVGTSSLSVFISGSLPLSKTSHLWKVTERFFSSVAPWGALRDQLSRGTG